MVKSRRRILRHMSDTWVVPVLIALLICTVFGVFYMTAFLLDSNRHQAENQFNNQTRSVTSAMQSRIALYTSLLYNLQAAYSAKRTPMSRDQFHGMFEYIDIKDRYPGLSAVSFTQHVAPEDLEAFTRGVRQDTSLSAGGYPDFIIMPNTTSPDPYVITFTEPFTLPNPTFGLDISSDPNRYEAVKSARDTAQLQSTGPIKLLSSTTKEKTLGFIVFAPLYVPQTDRTTIPARRENILGVINAVFHADDLFAGIVRESGASPAMKLSVIDTAATPGSQVLYRSTADQGAGGEDIFHKTTTLKFGGKSWTLAMSAPQTIGLSRFETLAPMSVLGIGLLICLMLAVMVVVLARSRSRALRMAERITRELQESEAQYREITQNSQELITLLSPDGIISFASPASQSILAYKPSEIVGRAITDLIVEDDVELVRDALRRIADIRTQNLKLEYRIRSHAATEAVVWVEALWQSVDLHGKSLIQISSRDITERKRVEDSLRRQTDELERLNQAMVGREMKMIELKRRMKEGETSA